MKYLSFLVICCWLSALAVAEEPNANELLPKRHQSLSDSIRLLDVTRGVLRKVTKVRWLSKVPHLDWILQKLDTVHLYVSAGQTLAEKLDPDLLDALSGATESGRSEENWEPRSSSFDDYLNSWRRRPAAIPAYIRKSKTKLSDDDEEELDEEYSASYQERGYYGGGGHSGGGKGYGGR